MTVKVKICGMTRAEDIREAVAAGANALGFVFYGGSPRAVAEEQVRSLLAEVPPFVTRVGLFVNESAARVNQVMRRCRLDLAQLHGDEPPEYFADLDCRAIKVLRVRDRQSLERRHDYPGEALLLDAWDPERFGGTGERFDWTLAAEVARERPVILAGGLTPENVREAVERVRPYAVDVSSGVEAAPGAKDPAKLKLFIRNAKELHDEL